MSELYHRDEVPQRVYWDRKYYMTFEDQLESLKGATTLYVGNLSFQTTELQIRETFSRVGPIKRIIMGLNRETKAYCGFCFVEYYTYEHACACLKYISGTMCDGQIIRCELDGGFQPGRQYGRGKSGGQVRNEKAAAFNDGKPSFTPPSSGKRDRSERDSYDRRPSYDGRDRRDSYDKGKRDSFDRDRRDRRESFEGRDGRRVVVDERRRDHDRGGYKGGDRNRHGDSDRDRRSGGDSRRGREERNLDSRLTSELSTSRLPRTRDEAASGRSKEDHDDRAGNEDKHRGASAAADDNEESGSRGRRRGGDSDEDETSGKRFRRDSQEERAADDDEAGEGRSREHEDN